MKADRFARALAAVLFTLAPLWASAEPAKIDRDAEMKAASDAVKAVIRSGPAEIPLAGQAVLKLPAGYSFIPQPAADQMLKALGNGSDPTRLGIILPPEGTSFIVPRYIASGYIKDDEAKDWKADELLDSLKAGTEEGNKERQARGLPEMEIVGWRQKPAYDNATHRLTWAIESKDKGPSDEEHGANYNTYVLGREGYLSMNLVTGLAELPANKPFVETMLAHTDFDAGKRYADFNATTDKVAEYGIAALVTGVVAKKLGLFALVAAFVLKFAKLFAIAAFGVFAAVAKFFKRGKPDASAP